MKASKKENLVQIIKQGKEALFLPYGLDKQWDTDCDNSFLRFLDVTYWTLLSLIVLYPVLGGVILLWQKYGK